MPINPEDIEFEDAAGDRAEVEDPQVIDLEILMIPFATWGMILGFIALVIGITWIFHDGGF